MSEAKRNKGKKVVIVANTSWNIHNFRKNILRALISAGYDVVTLTPVDGFMDFLNEFPEVRHIELSKLHRKSINPFYDLLLLNELHSIYKKEKPDIIIHYTIKPNIYGSIAARMTKLKCISVITGLGYTFIHNGMLGWFSEQLYRNGLRSNEKVIFENDDDRLLFLDKKIISSENAISVKGCGVDTEYFSPRKGKGERKKNIFLFMGRLLYDKGIKEFVSAARIVKNKYPGTEFWIAGDIDKENPAAISEKELSDWIEKGIIKYKGFLSDVRDDIEQSDCVVLPSYREAIARTLQEGMAMGKPVIAADVAGSREAVQEGVNGYLVPVKNAEALASAMEKFIGLDSADRKVLGDNGRKQAMEVFDERIIAAKYMEVIQSALK